MLLMKAIHVTTPINVIMLLCSLSNNVSLNWYRNKASRKIYCSHEFAKNITQVCQQKINGFWYPLTDGQLSVRVNKKMELEDGSSDRESTKLSAE